MADPGYVTPRRARAIRVLLDSEHQDAVHFGEVPPGPRPLVLPPFRLSAPKPRRASTIPVTSEGLW